MGFAFSGGSQSVETKYPKWVTRSGSGAGGIAEKIAKQPYQRYTGARVSPLTGGQQEAIGARWNTETANRYMNPYRDTVIKRINEEAAKKQIGTDAGLIQQGGVGAFGGARAGIMAGENEEARLNAIGAAEADAYERARSAFETEQDRLLETGTLEQLQGQRSLDVAYGDFLEERDWLERGLNAYIKALGGSPGATGSEVPTASLAQQLTGLGVAGAGLWKLMS